MVIGWNKYLSIFFIETIFKDAVNKTVKKNFEGHTI